MKKLLPIFLLVISFTAFPNDADTVTVAFWNLENLFDTVDDPVKDDAEYLEGAEKQWSEERLDKKFYNLSRVIKLMDSTSGGPDLLGVCEVEHQHLLDSLIARYFPGKNYKSIAVESPDNRGIDNGLIYNADLFSVLSVIADTVNLPDKYPTRPVLNVNLLVNGKDTVSVFINHWPSRRGGEDESNINRVVAAEVLRKRVNTLFVSNSNSRIIILGDFNDEPTNESVLQVLGASPIKCDSIPAGLPVIKPSLYNLSYSQYEAGLGSYKYRDDWNMLDQVIVSTELITGEKFSYICNSFEVFKPEIMVTRSGKYEGAPFPTYGGSRYLGGYSDHFPVITKFLLRK